jgi:hypothetical protein
VTAVIPSMPSAAHPAVVHLRCASTVRARAHQVLAAVRNGQSSWWHVHTAALGNCADVVADVTRARYPDLRIPFHSRWRHFEAQGLDRVGTLVQPALVARGADALELARCHLDLVITAVLLDAGAGPDWRYTETTTGQVHTRSEGLGVAALHAFASGLFSARPDQPLRADAQALHTLSTEALAQAFQVSEFNPLVGLDGRAALLRRLGAACEQLPGQRPGGLVDVLWPQARQGEGLRAGEVLVAVLNAFSTIWPSGQTLLGAPMGDCWPCTLASGSVIDPPESVGWAPFHKLSQWLTYSLLEPLQWAGWQVVGLDDLTGLPEYRNGGLLIDAGVLQWRNPVHAQRTWHVGDDAIVQWRALTVALLDELAPLVRQRLGTTARDMPLACILEGGTWAAGRELARRLHDALPPLNIASDGTVF